MLMLTTEYSKHRDIARNYSAAQIYTSFDLVTVVVKNKIKAVVSQNCTDIDGIATGTDAVVPSKRSFSPRGSKLRSSQSRVKA